MFWNYMFWSKEAGLRAGGWGAGGACGRPCPLSLLCCARGAGGDWGAAWTWTLPPPPAAQCESRRRPGSLISPSPPPESRSTYRSRKERLGWVRFGSKVPLDAMSRRKLGSRPQHLSAIQGKLDWWEDPGPGFGSVGGLLVRGPVSDSW